MSEAIIDHASTPLRTEVEATTGRHSRKPDRARGLVLAAALSVAVMLAWLQYRTLTSITAALEAAQGQNNQMRVDAARILALRRAPRSATTRPRESAQLLAQVETALQQAGIDKSAWLDAVPQPPARIPRTPYRQMTTQLYLHDVTLKQLAAFAYDLCTEDPTLYVASIAVTNPRDESAGYDVTVAVAYRVFSPSS